MMKLKNPEEIINVNVDFNAMSDLRKVIVLKGHQNDGKTAILTELIMQMHLKHPDAWICRKMYSPEKFDISRIKENAAIKDNWGVFRINGVVVAIYTGGDNPSVISRTFTIAARYKSQIFVTALKVDANGAKTSRVQVAYEYIKQKINFEEVVVNICGSRFRKSQYEHEVKIAKGLVASIEDSIRDVKQR